MSQHQIVALRCPSCGSGISEPSREVAFGAEFRCDVCGISSVLIIDRALIPLGNLQKEEKVCLTCGRIAVREARFCQEGHPLTRKCPFRICGRDFPVDHQRCDFCGMLYPIAPLQLGQVYQGFVSFETRTAPSGVVYSVPLVDVGVAVGPMDVEELDFDSDGVLIEPTGPISVVGCEKEGDKGRKSLWFRRADIEPRNIA